MMTMAIPQADLARLVDVSERKKHWKREYDALRESILARHRSGGSVESGYLDISVLECEQRSFSRGQLVRILGEVETERLWARLTPTIQTRLTVITSQ